ncbi:MAG: hypothetical protein AAFZ15_04510 [Bacteroidota bacterium]
MPDFQFFRLSSDGTGKVTYAAPDGNNYIIDPGSAGNGWIFTYDTNSKPVMAFRKGNNATDNDGELVVSLDGANSIISSLLHYEDDYPRKYYYASDGGNNNPLNRRAFILRCDGINGSPVQRWCSLMIMTVKP